MVHHMTRDMSRRSLAGLPAVALVLTVACAHAQITGEAETRKFVSCRTLVTWTGPQGTQVSYLGAGNKAYLWAPGNDTVLSGTWWVGTGNKYDPANLTVPMKQGTFVTHFGNRVHWDGAKDEDATLLIIGEGPVTTMRVDEAR